MKLKPIKIKNKRGGFSDIFLFMIFAVVIVFFLGIFLYIATTITYKLHTELDDMQIGSSKQNVSQVIDATVGKTTSSFQAFYWIAILLIVGMMLSIFIGSYLVTTKPIFLIPYIFIVIISIVVAVGISNACEQVFNDPTLASTFNNFLGAKWMLLRLPIIVSIIGIVGGIIMFSLAGSREEVNLYGY